MRINAEIEIIDVREHKSWKGTAEFEEVSFNCLSTETHTYRLDNGFIVSVTLPQRERHLDSFTTKRD